MTTSRLEVVDLLQQMIRNECVNDGSDASGHETRTADLLMSELEGSGADFAIYERRPAGRRSWADRGERQGRPSICWLGHTDVVPANRTGGRGILRRRARRRRGVGPRAVDMLNLTASMSVAFDRLARSGFRRRNTRARAVADEEALGSHGAGWLREHETDAVKCDYVITETGGIPLEGPSGKRLPVMVGEKGSCWCRLRVHGEAGHASNLCAPTTPS